MGERHTTMYCHHCQQQTSAVQPTPNHILHLLITLFLCGLWIPVWILCALFPGAKRCTACGSTPRSGGLIGTAIKGVATVMVLVFLGVAYTTYSNRTSSSAIQSPPTMPVARDEAPSVPPNEATDEVSAEPLDIDSTPEREARATTQDDLDSEPVVESPPDEPLPESPEPEQAEPSLRTWTSTTGHTVEAELRSVLRDKVSLKKANGKIVTVPLDKFVPADQEYINEWKKQKRRW